MTNKNYSQPPKEVIVVEGRDDTMRLIETFGKGVKTIETNGSAIDKAVLEQIRYAHEHIGVIVLTDPDYPGERIRRIIEQEIPTAKHAYIERQDAQANRQGQSLGVEHASKEAIIKALEEVMTPSEDISNLIPMSDLHKLQLMGHPLSSRRREYIAQHYKLGHINGKQLQKRLAMYNIELEELKKTLKEGEENGTL